MSVVSEYRSLTSTTSEAVSATEQKLRGFSSLSEGWHFGEGHGPTITAMKVAAQVLRASSGLHVSSDVFPGTNGSVAVAFYRDERCVEVTVDPDGGLAVFVEEGLGFSFHLVCEIPQAKWSDIILQLTALARPQRWSSFDLSTLRCSILEDCGSRTWSSSTALDLFQELRTERRESLSSTQSVHAQELIPPVFANMSLSTINIGSPSLA